MQEISSITTSFQIQASLAHSINLLNPSSSLRSLQNGFNMFITSSLLKQDQIPSLATTMNSSPACRWIMLMVGQLMMPMDYPTWSPKTLVMARPGPERSCSQTRLGPTYLPWRSLYLSIRPPRSMILCFSLETSRLWSWVSTESWPFRERMALLSPRWARYMMLSFEMRMTVAVDPLEWVLMWEFLRRSSASVKEFWRMVVQNRLSCSRVKVFFLM